MSMDLSTGKSRDHIISYNYFEERLFDCTTTNTSMPDAFFQSERKRKRPSTSSRGRGGDRNTSRGRGRGGARPQRQRDNDEDLSSEADAADLDNLDFRAGREDKAPSDDEVVDEDETAAEKRVRLAKGYLQKVRDQLEAGT